MVLGSGYGSVHTRPHHATPPEPLIERRQTIQGCLGAAGDVSGTSALRLRGSVCPCPPNIPLGRGKGGGACTCYRILGRCCVCGFESWFGRLRSFSARFVFFRLSIYIYMFILFSAQTPNPILHQWARFSRPRKVAAIRCHPVKHACTFSSFPPNYLTLRVHVPKCIYLGLEVPPIQVHWSQSIFIWVHEPLNPL